MRAPSFLTHYIPPPPPPPPRPPRILVIPSLHDGHEHGLFLRCHQCCFFLCHWRLGNPNYMPLVWYILAAECERNNINPTHSGCWQHLSQIQYWYLLALLHDHQSTTLIQPLWSPPVHPSHGHMKQTCQERRMRNNCFLLILWHVALM